MGVADDDDFERRAEAHGREYAGAYADTTKEAAEFLRRFPATPRILKLIADLEALTVGLAAQRDGLVPLSGVSEAFGTREAFKEAGVRVPLDDLMWREGDA